MLSSVLLILTMFASGYAVVQGNMSKYVQTAFLSSHNKLRSSFSLPGLVWNSTLATVAENEVLQCVSNNGPSQDVEDKLYAKRRRFVSLLSIVFAAFEGWANEVNFVDSSWQCIFASEGNCGHYSQILWRNTTSVGCAMAPCDDDVAGSVVCKYYAPGNIIGETPY